MNRDGKKVAAVASPASVLEQSAFESGVTALERLGFEVRLMKNVNRHGSCAFTAGTPEERAQDIENAYLDGETDIVWCVRGGGGAAGVLECLDWEILKRRPDLPVAGYSDITALHFALWKFNAGLPVAAPMLGQLADFTAEEAGRAALYSLLEDQAGRERPVIFGNLAVAAGLCGTPYLPDAAGKTVVLEEINEAPYRLDRMFSQLWQSGFFEGVEKLVFGHFTNCDGGVAGAEMPVLEYWNSRINKGAGLIRANYGHQLPFSPIRADRSFVC